MKEATDVETIHDIARLAAAFGPRGWPAVELYLNTFQTAHDRPLKPDKVRLLLEEIKRFWDDERFIYERKEWVISRTTLISAMRHVGLTEKVGFKNHNYLKKVAIGFQHQINQRAAREERKREEELKDSMHRDSRGPQRIKEILNGLEK